MAFGWSKSEPKAGGEPGVAPSREARKKCWEARDAYFACLDKNHVVQPGDPAVAGELGDKQRACEAARALYEGACGKSWIDYFNKRRVLEIRSQKTLAEAERQRNEAAKR